VTDRRVKHGMSNSPEYRAWRRILTRCYYPRHDKYAWYGGRGIVVCERWRESFKAFYEDMGPRPTPKHTIERKENDGNYEPGNCRWATQHDQSRNTSRNINLTFRGRTQCVQDWASELGIGRATVQHRLDVGWTVERALTEEVRTVTFHMLTLDGETMTLTAWARRLGITKKALSARLHKGWSIKAALSTPKLGGCRG
jgi:hypothetical protein